MSKNDVDGRCHRMGTSAAKCVFLLVGLRQDVCFLGMSHSYGAFWSDEVLGPYFGENISKNMQQCAKYCVHTGYPTEALVPLCTWNDLGPAGGICRAV